MFQLEISDISVNLEQFLNNLLIYLRLIIFHFPISGIDNNEKHPLNRPSIFFTFSVFQLEISGNSFSDTQLKNI